MKMKHILLDADLILLHVQVHGLAELLFVQAKLHFHEQIYHFSLTIFPLLEQFTADLEIVFCMFLNSSRERFCNPISVIT